MSDKVKRQINLGAIVAAIVACVSGIAGLVGHEFGQATDIQGAAQEAKDASKEAKDARDLANGVLSRLDKFGDKLGVVAEDVASIKGSLKRGQP